MSEPGTELPPREELPYRIELWHAQKDGAIEQVLARALSAQLARAIYKAAQDEHPQRRITLRKGDHIIADSAAGDPPSSLNVPT